MNNKITHEVVTVTPAQALDWLECNTHNRNLAENRVTKMARDIAGGNWQFTGDAIKFAEDGTLLDGQHRLAAVAEAGVPVPFLVVRGLPAQAQEAMDLGRARTVGDTLRLRGERNPAHVAALAVAVLTEGKTGGSARFPTPHEQLEAVERDPLIRTIAAEIIPELGLRALMTPTTAGWAYYRLHHVDVSDCAKFFRALSELTDLPHGSPILALHRRLLAERNGANTPEHRRLQYSLIFRSWNQWRRGDSVSKLQVTFGSGGKVVVPEPI